MEVVRQCFLFSPVEAMTPNTVIQASMEYHVRRRLVRLAGIKCELSKVHPVILVNSNTSTVHKLHRHGLQHLPLHEWNIHPVADASNLPVGSAKFLVVAHPIPHRLQHRLLHHLLLHPNLPLLTTKQDLEPHRSWTPSQHRRPLHRLRRLHQGLRHFDAACANLPDSEPADVRPP